VFLDETFLPTSLAETGPLAAVAPRLPGPGFWESIAWISGLMVVQFAAVMMAMIVLVLWSLATSRVPLDAGRPPDGAALVQNLVSRVGENFIVVLGSIQLAIIGYAFLAVQFRQRFLGLARLGWRFPRFGHWLLVVVVVLPLTALCTQLQSVVFKLVPWSQDQFTQLVESMEAAPLWLAVLGIGAGPALGEELMFRGFIGRGLMARYGVSLGIVVTSVMFGAMHVNPGQVVGTIPLGFAMHFVYLTTRSFWAPMTLHFLNNTFSVVMLKVGADVGVKELADESTSLPGSLLVTSACLVAAIGLLLWQTRIRFVTSDGTAWDPGYATCDVPPAEAGALPVSHPAAPGLVFGVALCALGFVAAAWMMVVGG
jgi:membrane protease YdiL (CAAX protease family)